MTSWLLCIIACYALFGLDQVGAGQCHEHESSLLLELKNSLVFYPHRSTNLDWNSSIDCCLWPGVGCSESGQYVTALDLSSESIKELSFSTLFDLQHLTSLSLAYNNFHTLIPSEIGKLTELTNLNLAEAGFYGQIPIEISNLTRLVTLNLKSNENTRLVIETPNLQMLIGNLSKLEDLRLDYVDLSTESHVWGQVLSSSLPNLKILTLTSCGLSGPIHASLGNHTSLGFISLSLNAFDAPFPLSFSNLKNLEGLDLYECGLIGKFPPEILQVQSLTYLDLCANYQLQGSLPVFPKDSSLRSLGICNTKFSGTIPASIQELKLLTLLNLSGCNFTGPLPDSFPSQCYMEVLILNGNTLQGIIPKSLGECKSLQVLDLRNNKLNDTFPSWLISSLLDLRVLIIRSNSFYGIIESSKTNCSQCLTKLQILDIASNSFTRNLPSQELLGWKAMQLVSDDLVYIVGGPFFHYMRSVSLIVKGQKQILSNILNISTYIDFSDNKFEGKIPYEFGYLKVLHALNISGNKLSGQIPSCIGNLTELESLDLSRNGLSGSITTQLAGLTFLSTLNLSFNQLQGEIPNGGQMQTV